MSRPPRLTTVARAVGSIPDGALVATGGFDLNRAPMALVFELLRQRRRRLRVVSLPNPLPLDLLVAGDAVESATFGFLGFQYEDGFVTVPHVKRAIETATLSYDERDVYEIVQALRAAALGLPHLPAPGGRPAAEGAAEVAAIRPDVALLHAQVADRDGNLRIDDPYADDLLARAATRVVATAERIVDRIDEPTVPGFLVESVAEAPGGAFPTSCYRSYRHSAAHLRNYLAAAASGGTAGWLETYVTGTADLAAFLRLVENPGRWNVEEIPRAPGAQPVTARTGADAAATEAVDRIVLEMARSIDDGDVVATGVASALPMLAVALARATHARHLTYINCVGAVDPDIAHALPSSVDPALLDRCRARVALTDLFDLARRGRIDTMFFGAAQVDGRGHANLTAIGDARPPRVKLPGPAGSCSMRSGVRKVVLTVARHSPRSLPETVDVTTSAPSPANTATILITDRARLELKGGGWRVASRRPDVSFADLKTVTGFPLSEDGGPDRAPSRDEREALDRIDPDGLRRRML